MTSTVQYEDLQDGGDRGGFARVGVGPCTCGESSTAIARRVLAIVLFVLVLQIFLIGAQPVIADAVNDQTDIATAAAVAAAVAAGRNSAIVGRPDNKRQTPSRSVLSVCEVTRAACGLLRLL